MRKNSKLKKIISKKVKKYRKEVGLTQEELAAKVKVSRVFIGYIEQAKDSPSLELLGKIAKVLKVKVSDLLD